MSEMKNKFSILILVGLILTSCSIWPWQEKDDTTNDTNKEDVEHVSVEIIQKWSFSEQLKLIWKIKPESRLNITPLNSGEVSKVNFKLWDKVNIWDILAIIDNNSNLSNINLLNAENAYNNAINVYNLTRQSLDGSIESRQLQYENTVISRNNVYEATKKQLEITQTQLDNLINKKGNTVESNEINIELAKQWVESAELSLENFMKSYDKTLNTLDVTKQNLLNNIKDTINGIFVITKSSIESADEKLWVTNKNYNNSRKYSSFFWVKDANSLNRSRDDLEQVMSIYDSIKDIEYKNLDEGDLLEYLNSLDTLVNALQSLYDSLVDALNMSITQTGNDALLGQITTEMSSIQWQVLQIQPNITNLNNAYRDLQNTIKSTIIDLDNQKLTIEQSIKSAKTSLENTKKMTSSWVDDLDANINTTKIQLEQVINDIEASRKQADKSLDMTMNQLDNAKIAKDTQLAQMQSQIDSAKWQIDTLNKQSSNSTIISPVSGIIVDKNIEVWQVVSGWMSVFTIENQDNNIVELDISSDNAKNLKIWDKVKLETWTTVIEWSISLITNSNDPNTSMQLIKISYDNKQLNWYANIWDFVSVYINKNNSSNDNIVVPFSSLVILESSQYSVYLVDEDNIVREQKVFIGPSNSLSVVITRWLKEWDRIITKWALNVVPWDKVIIDNIDTWL